MTSASNGLPPGPAATDLILLALFQARLHEQSRYLGQVIQSERQHLPDEPDEASAAETARIRLAEQALAAVQEAEERIGRGRYGLCDRCHDPIGWDELLESPERTACRTCRPAARRGLGLTS